MIWVNSRPKNCLSMRVIDWSTKIMMVCQWLNPLMSLTDLWISHRYRLWRKKRLYLSFRLHKSLLDAFSKPLPTGSWKVRYPLWYQRLRRAFRPWPRLQSNSWLHYEPNHSYPQPNQCSEPRDPRYTRLFAHPRHHASEGGFHDQLGHQLGWERLQGGWL